MMTLDPMMTMDDQKILSDAVLALPEDAVIVEYGGGGSTIMLTKLLQGSQRLITIEHNVDWYHKIKTALADVDGNFRSSLNLRTPDAESSVWPFGQYYEETPYACADYIHAVDVFIPWDRVRMVLVDGFVRGAVLAMLTTKLTTHTSVFLHDYLNREAWYEWAVRLYDVMQLPEGESPDRKLTGPIMPNSLLSLRSR